MVSGIPNIIKDLSDDLKARVEAVIQLTEAREELEVKLAEAKRDLKRVHIALEALNGSPIPIPADTETDPEPHSGAATKEGSYVRPSGPGTFVEPVVPSPIPVPVQATDPRPLCNSCGSGRMNYTSRTLNNGKVVTLWLCSECRNERF